MKGIRERLSLLIVAALFCLGAARSSFAEDLAPSPESGRPWKLSTSLNYESGDFGTGTRSSSLYVPLTLKRYWGDWSASLTIPYLSQSSDGQVTNVGGRPSKTGKGRGTGATSTQAGLGDIVGRGGYALMQEDEQPLDLSLAAKVKVPTADKGKGLGTGEFDAGAGLEFAKVVAPDWTLLADMYYTAIGAPPGSDLRNQAAVDAGFSYLIAQKATLTALLEASNALVAGESAPAALRGILDYKVSEQGGVFVGLLVGVSDGSPDYGFSLGGSYRF